MEIQHDITNQRFFILLEGKEAYLQYLIADKNVLNYYKTYVPNELRGKGIAGKIVEAALNYARENNLKIIPTCSYVDTFIERHKNFEDLIKN